RHDLEIEFAEIWLFRQGDPARAAACCRELLARTPGDRDARDLLELALAAQKEWGPLAQHLIDAPGGDAEALIDAARGLLDGGGDPKKAATLAQSAVDQHPGDLHAIELLLELAALGAAKPVSLLEAKLAALGEDPRASGERAATVFSL